MWIRFSTLVVVMAVFVPGLGCADIPDMATPEFRMGLENFYAKTDSNDLLTREEVAKMVGAFEMQLTCAQKALSTSTLPPLDWPMLKFDAEQFKKSPYSANQSFRFYASRTLVLMALATIGSRSEEAAQCAQEKNPDLLARFMAHIQLLTYSGDLMIAAQNHPKGPKAFAKPVVIKPEEQRRR